MFVVVTPPPLSEEATGNVGEFVIQLYSKPQATQAQMDLCQTMVRKPVLDTARYGRIWDEVYSLRDAYVMND